MPDPTAPDPRPASMRRRVDFDTTPEAIPTAPEHHDPPADATCGERIAILGTAHACRWATHDGDAHACICGCTWRPRERGCEPAPVTAETECESCDICGAHPCRGGCWAGEFLGEERHRCVDEDACNAAFNAGPTAPVTAEDLRAELTAQLDSEPYLTPAETVDGVMVVLDRLGVIDHANRPVSSHASEHAAAEDLRERLIAVIKSIRIHPKLDPTVTAMIMAGVGFHVTDDEAKPLADAIVAALAGDPGDLPARMAAELNSHEWEPGQRHTAHRTHNYHGACAICQGDLPRIAAAAMSVRWEHAASQAAGVERLREIERVTTPPADELEMPADPAELREMWEFINRQSRWQYHMAHKFGEQVERLRAELAEARELARKRGDHVELQSQALDKVQAELDELKAAVGRVRALHSPRDRGAGPECMGCRTTATFTRYEVCRTLAALDAEGRKS